MENKFGVKIKKTNLINIKKKNGKKLLRYCLIKRILDIVISLIGIILLLPVFIITVIAIWCEDGGPIIYTQERIGKNFALFKIYKFRSMRKDAEKIHEKMREKYKNNEVSFKLQDDPRVTNVGKIIRKFNVDELPQLLNIINGDMSFVGPRPLPVYEYKEAKKRYGKKYIERYYVPQGLTCYWQISDRAKQSFEARMQLDVDYAKQCNFIEDMKLFVKTFVFTITGKAAY